jgi:hypothetical protein
MMELRCPDCCSPEVLPDLRKSPGARRCGNCDASFNRDSALVTVADDESDLGLARRIEDALLEVESPQDDRDDGAAVPALATA